MNERKDQVVFMTDSGSQKNNGTQRARRSSYRFAREGSTRNSASSSYADEHGAQGRGMDAARQTADRSYRSAHADDRDAYGRNDSYGRNRAYDRNQAYDRNDDAYDDTYHDAYGARSGGNSQAEHNDSGFGFSGSSGFRRRGKKRPPVLRILLILVLVFVVAVIGKTLSKGIHWTVAVFGVDSRDGELEKGTRSDVIMLADINQLTGTVKLVSVFRDSYLRIDRDGNYSKINAAYERGGHAQAIQALEDNTDVSIDDYVTFNWAAVANAINALGGVDLEISDAEFSYINAFITETVNSTGIGSTQLQHAGMNHLDGVQAVAYGRLRKMDTDYNRTARQRKVLGLALAKAKQQGPAAITKLAGAILPQVSTSVDMTDLIPVINTLGRFHIPDDASSGFPFSRKAMNIGKLDAVVPTTLASNVVTLHEFLYGKKNFKPSKTVEEISQHIAEKTGLTQPGENAPEAGTGGGIALKPKQTAAAPAESKANAKENESESLTEATDEETESTSESTEEKETKETLESDEYGDILPGEDGEIHDGPLPGQGPGETQPDPFERPTETQDGSTGGPGETTAAQSKAPETSAPVVAGNAEDGPGV